MDELEKACPQEGVRWKSDLEDWNHASLLILQELFASCDRTVQVWGSRDFGDGRDIIIISLLLLLFSLLLLFFFFNFNDVLMAMIAAFVFKRRASASERTKGGGLQKGLTSSIIKIIE